MKRIRTVYRIQDERIQAPMRLAVAADLHSGEFEDVMEDFRSCDAVLLPGDLIDRHRRNNVNAERFLREVAGMVPVFYSIGNHERKYKKAKEWFATIQKSKAVLLDDRAEMFREIWIGGLSSRAEKPNMQFLNRLEKKKEFKLLMCHHPEVYRDYVRGRRIDFTVCGHAHGGQIQIGGQGLYAPGQGFFPKLTHGVHDDGKMMISRGMTNGAKPRIPRWGNPCELIILELTGKK